MLKKEIGSEFWDAPINNKGICGYFSEANQWFVAGRSALKAIIKEINHCRTIAMPSWCCDSMVKPFLNAGMEVCYYPVFFENGLIQHINFDCDVLFLMDYFGYLSRTPDLSSYNGVIIRDVTHSIFSSNPNDSDYYFGSLRKWCGVCTGGYAWTKDGHMMSIERYTDDIYVTLRKKAMRLKKSYIHNREASDKSYLKIFEEAEKRLDDARNYPAVEEDILIAKKLDVDFIKTRRRLNAQILQKAFPDWLIFSIMGDNDCPMFVPILVPNAQRDALRNYLIKNDIYCPVHWPLSKYHKLNEKEKFLYKNELSLVCDQRYDANDMNRMIKIIELFWKETRHC